MTPPQGLPSLLGFLQLQPTRLRVSPPGSMPLVCHVPIFICICIVWLLLYSLIPSSLLILSTGSFDPLLTLCSFRLTSGERAYSSPLVALWSHLLSLFPVCFYPPPASGSREALFRKNPQGSCVSLLLTTSCSAPALSCFYSISATFSMAAAIVDLVPLQGYLQKGLCHNRSLACSMSLPS